MIHVAGVVKTFPHGMSRSFIAELRADEDYEKCALSCGQVTLPSMVWEHALIMLADEQATPEQIKIMRAMPGERKLRLAERLYWSVREMKAAGVRTQHPDWPPERVSAEVRKIFLHART